MTLRSGRLSQRVTLQSRSPGLDAYGQQKSTWEDVATVWAEVTPQAGAEPTKSGAQREVAHYTAVIRYRSGTAPAMRLLFNGQVLNIQSVVDEGSERRYMTLVCHSGLNDG